METYSLKISKSSPDGISPPRSVVVKDSMNLQSPDKPQTAAIHYQGDIHERRRSRCVLNYPLLPVRYNSNASQRRSKYPNQIDYSLGGGRSANGSLHPKIRRADI